MIDTHAHLYVDAFGADLSEVLQRAHQAGIEEIWLPGTDAASLREMERFRALQPSTSLPNAASTNHPINFRFFAGLHPCEVNANFSQELASIGRLLEESTYDGIGEIGLDLYWDKTFYEQQCIALTTQFDWALERKQPVLIHVRDAFDQMLPLIRPYFKKGLTGIFHSFSGSLDQAKEVTDAGFLLGINGVVTFKKSHLPELLTHIPLTAIVTETDAPYLTPSPHRGQRNESSYIPLIVDKLSAIYQLPSAEIVAQTTSNANTLLGQNPSSKQPPSPIPTLA